MSVDQDPGSNQPTPHQTVPWATLAPTPQLPRLWTGDKRTLTKQVPKERTAARRADGTVSAPRGGGGWGERGSLTCDGTTEPRARSVLFAKMFFKPFMLPNLADVTNKSETL